jgi:hypothetical protein
MPLDSTMLAMIRKAAEAIIKASKKEITNAQRNEIVWATVDSIQAGPPQTLTLKIGGATTTNAAVAYGGWYSPTVGDYVMCLHYGTDLIVMGTMAPGGAPSKPERTFAVAGTLSAATLPGFHANVADSLKIVSVRGVLGAGTCTVDLLVNGTSIGTYSMTTTTLALTAVGHALSDGDYVQIKISSPSSASDLGFDVNCN